MDYVSKIEELLGDWKLLPNYPFKLDFGFVIFPSVGDNLINEELYQEMFLLSQKFESENLIFKSFVDMKKELPDLLIQNQPNWKHFDGFQTSNLVYEGFYVTDNNYNWLGIYHPDDYFIIGAKKEILLNLCLKVYGHSDWKMEFKKDYENGKLEIYQADYLELTKCLF